MKSRLWQLSWINADGTAAEQTVRGPDCNSAVLVLYRCGASHVRWALVGS